MIERIGGIPSPTPRGPESEDRALAQKLREPLEYLIDALKNLSPTAATEDHTLSAFSQNIINLHAAAQTAANLRD